MISVCVCLLLFHSCLAWNLFVSVYFASIHVKLELCLCLYTSVPFMPSLNSVCLCLSTSVPFISCYLAGFVFCVSVSVATSVPPIPLPPSCYPPPHPKVNLLCCWFPFRPSVTAVASKRSGHSTISAGGRLQLNTRKYVASSRDTVNSWMFLWWADNLPWDGSSFTWH